MSRNGECCPKKAKRSGKRVDVSRLKYEAEYQTIKKLHSEGHKITYLCEALEVSRSGYYKWLNREPTKSEKRLKRLMELITDTYEKYEGIYGYRRITIYLNHYLDAKVNHKCVYRLMKLMGLKAVIRQKKYKYKASKPNQVAENILDRKFQEDYDKMEVILTDVTEFEYAQSRKAYFSAILDYGAKKIIAFNLSKRNDMKLVRETFEQISEDIVPGESLIHSDRGFQYTSYGFRSFVRKHGLIQSMSRTGKCIDNGPMEAFWGTIKEEMYRLKKYETFEELESDIKKYIEFYNNERVTLSMGLKIPA